MPSLIAVASGFPEHVYSQQELSAALREVWEEQGLDVTIFDRVQKNVAVESRHLTLPLERYRALSFEQANQAWQSEALRLGERILNQLLEHSGLPASEISLLATTTVTGLSVPSLEARLMNRIAFSPRTKRLPLFGLGCLAGTAGVARLHDYLLGQPKEAAILLSVELCSLTLQLQDLSMANLISSGLFGDGAAAVLMVGDQHPLASSSPRTRASRSLFFPDSEDVMGWKITNQGLQIVLGPGVPEYARRIRPTLETFLQEHSVRVAEVDFWLTHPGGPKVIQALEQTLELGEGALDHVRDHLRRYGNLSSTSVLLLLEEALQANWSGRQGVMLSMGPAFSAEMLLLQGA
jgi:alkylresorcinol/alkylpyrone synthase